MPYDILRDLLESDDDMPDGYEPFIRVDDLVDRLQSFALGEIEMTPEQVSAAVAVLEFTTPDIPPMGYGGDVVYH